MRLRAPSEWSIPDNARNELTKAVISACRSGAVERFKNIYDPANLALMPPLSYMIRLAVSSRWPPMLKHILSLFPGAPEEESISYTPLDFLAPGDRMPHVDYAILHAISLGDPLLLQVFLDAGMNVHHDVESDFIRVDCLLEHAINEDQIATARALLEAGADPNFILRGGYQTCVTRATGRESLGMLRLLLSHGGDLQKSYALWNLGQSAHSIEAAETILEEGCDINTVFTVRYPRGNQFDVMGTALHAVASCSEFRSEAAAPFASWLLEKGIDFNVKDGEGHTAMEVADIRGSEAVKRVFHRWAHDHDSCIE